MPRQKKPRLKRRADGRYACRYKDKWFMSTDPDEALAARDRYKQQEKLGVIVKRGMTVRQYAVYWLPVHKAAVRASTYNGYASIIEHAILPIADTPLSDLTTDDIAEVYAALSSRSASYINKAKILLTAILDSAVDAGYLIKNPARAQSVKPPHGKSGTHRPVTQEERDLICTVPHRMQLPAMIMLFCGLRRGEVLALTSADIGTSIRVSKAVSYVSNQPVISPPKTGSGIRTVPVFSVLRPYLNGLRGYVLPGKDGGPVTEQSFQRGWESYMKALSAAAGHPVSFRPHDLRVSFCTAARDAGVDIKQTIIWMGHADEKMILRIYDQPGSKREKASISAFESAIRRQNGRQPRVYRLKKRVK